MLGRYRTAGCRHHDNPGPDCVGNDRDTRRRKLIERRQVRREVAALLAERGRS